MKKLYRKSTVHPTPSVVSEHLLSFLPAAILALTAALSPADREVLAYLISCSSASFSNSHRGSKGGDDHPPCFSCNCFRCYMSYWVKWDSSPNRQLIHEIIDAFEESLLKESKKEKNRRERRKGKNVRVNNISLGILDEPKKSSEMCVAKEDFSFGESNAAADGGGGETGGGDEENNTEEEEEGELEKGSVRRFVSFLGERIWSVWG
ncbi:hypothetical protein PHJA_000652300 [Phtheirospermum japonicum]|uniref:Uncharacterized protein n=1 Tax=Phtheirospermum japonicum TaxID=374723 RepID=A0A830BMJ4_9LAMI|nr:hypothetical protein PHJA_000652300 [Phtheirospermum japonicum]